jgi:RimJ/RimL family protein N-acetyltransferase
VQHDAPVSSDVTLRSYTPADLPIVDRRSSEFEDHEPAGVDPRRALPSSSLDESGGLVVCQNGVPVGSVSWHYQQWGPTAGSRCLMIGISLLPQAQGRGIGTTAQAQLTDLIFAHTRMHRVEAATEIGNVAEQRALEKAGFTREGVIRESLWRRGEFHDSVLYSRLRTDPSAGTLPS